MSDVKESEAKVSPAETEAPASGVTAADAEKQISLAPVEAPIEAPPIRIPTADAATAETASSSRPVESSDPIESAKPTELPTPEATAPPTAEPASEQSAAASIAPSAAADSSSLPSIDPAIVAIAPRSRVASRANRFALLAASVTFAASVGALAGALSASLIARPAPPSAESPLAALDLTTLQDTIASVRSDVAGLKTSVDSSTRSSNAQFAKAAERFERIERAQSTSAAQLAKSIESLDRRTEGTKDVTGSTRPQPAAAVPTPAQEGLRGPAIDGWVVRNVHRNVAIIQGPRMGVIEVEAGDIVPGVGRIQAIRKQQNGRWVVVTSKGFISSAR